MDNENSAPSGESIIAKEDGLKMPSAGLKGRKAKLGRKIVQEEAVAKQEEDATAGDDFYASVLERFGIQI